MKILRNICLDSHSMWKEIKCDNEKTVFDICYL